ncbi:non-canonical purine NTP pyrophosphatase [Rhodobacteraceae bacterium 2376]|uniref:dITP/XTP pyrophosphatase n=1 Tax=Rhabdonatronobacter sediminivivens TaxID=2743469 RepID=A0A7Z0HZL3_9RHOB|nr:non-canonical purine NTP pyrophosphatase [Rhabdonatronobacter sediminivivens]NYS25213.1 non-canonical purine NTP pyrophosphatase [Rhabdonatronobacter sediminivivens]
MTRRLDGGALLVASHNAGKLMEFGQILAPRGITVTGAADHGLPEPEETESTFVGNARIKAHAAARATGLPALADDSGLVVDALDGAPGVLTADWAETPTGRDFGMAMEKTHGQLIARGAPRPWRARFACTLVLAWPDGHDEVFTGTAEGQLVWPIRGRDGHGYDPMFQPDGETRTFAEMSWDEKNAISHRGQAIAALLAGLFD